MNNQLCRSHVTITSNAYIPCLPNTVLSHTQQKLRKGELFTEYEFRYEIFITEIRSLSYPVAAEAIMLKISCKEWVLDHLNVRI